MSGIRFRELSRADCQRLFDWRSSEHVDAWMAGDPPASFSEHQAWFEEMMGSRDRLDWIIEQSGTAIGLLTLYWHDRAEGQVTWGYYIGDTDALGLGALIPPFLYNALFAFESVRSVLAEVLPANATVLRMHERHGYAPQDGPGPHAAHDTPSATALIPLVLTREAWAYQRRMHRLTAHLPGLEDFLTTNLES